MTFVFGDCEVHCERRELSRTGTRVHVEPQVFDLLVHLVRHRERVVSKAELIQTVWHGRSISDDALTSRVSAARRAIGDNGAEQRLIRTVPRRGFRFVGQVREEPNASAGTGRDAATEWNGRRRPAARGLLQDARRGTSGDSDRRERFPAGQDRQLAEPPGIRLAEPGMVPTVCPAHRPAPSDPV